MIIALLAGLAALAGVLVLLVAICTAARLGAARARRRRSRAMVALRPQVAAIVAAEEDSGPDRAGEQLIALAGRLRRAERRALTEVVLSFLDKLQGPARLPLVDLLVYDGTVPRARRDLQRRNWVHRAHGADILGRGGRSSCVGDLVALLDDPVAEVRAIAASGLPTVLNGEEVPDWVVHALLRTARSDRSLPAGLIVEVLLRFGTPAAPALLTPLAAGPDEVRQIAVEALGLLGATPAATMLAEALHDPDSRLPLRVQAATALGRIGVPSVVGALIGALEEEQPAAVRRAAALALARLGNPAAIGPLAALLDAPHPLPAVAAAALARLGPGGLAALEQLADQRAGSDAGRYASAQLASQRVRTVACADHGRPDSPWPAERAVPARVGS